MALSFSIIVPTFNRKAMLVEALDSVIAQHWPDLEIIVPDGGSTDGTIEMLEKYDNIRLLKGPDGGVYDALNKGIAAAAGDIVGLLNSDDLYEPATFALVEKAFVSNPSADAVCGTALLVENGRIVATFGREADKTIKTPRTVFLGSCVPNARFFRRSALQRVGLFRTDYRYIADRDWLARWYEARLSTIPLSQIVYRYRQHTGSLTFGNDPKRDLDIRRELLHLSRSWRANPDASSETRSMAQLLEGRCLAKLLVADISTRRWSDALSLLKPDYTIGLVQSLAALTLSGVDWMRQRIQTEPL